jgi:hypothetical protein
VLGRFSGAGRGCAGGRGLICSVGDGAAGESVRASGFSGSYVQFESLIGFLDGADAAGSRTPSSSSVLTVVRDHVAGRLHHRRFLPCVGAARRSRRHQPSEALSETSGSGDPRRSRSGPQERRLPAEQTPGPPGERQQAAESHGVRADDPMAVIVSRRAGHAAEGGAVLTTVVSSTTITCATPTTATISQRRE